MSADWARLYESTYADLLRFLMSKVWDEERARDLVQETFVRALEHQPDNPRAWLNLGAALFARGDLDDAEAFYEKALRLYPSYARAEEVAMTLIQHISPSREIPALANHIPTGLFDNSLIEILGFGNRALDGVLQVGL